MSRKKAGVCKCGHEIRNWHDPETGQCMHGLEWKVELEANVYAAQIREKDALINALLEKVHAA